MLDKYMEAIYAIIISLAAAILTAIAAGFAYAVGELITHGVHICH